MIKRYNQFVKGKINEDFEMYPETDTPTRTLPSLGGNMSKNIEVGSEFTGEEEEEEEGSVVVVFDKYTDALQRLADEAEKKGLNYNIVRSDDEKTISAVEIDNRKITFPSENEEYVVEGVKKPFKTLQEVITYFENGVSPKAKQEVRDEMASISDEEVLDRQEQFESKSYKNRRFKK